MVNSTAITLAISIAIAFISGIVVGFSLGHDYWERHFRRRIMIDMEEDGRV